MSLKNKLIYIGIDLPEILIVWGLAFMIFVVVAILLSAIGCATYTHQGLAAFLWYFVGIASFFIIGAIIYFWHEWAMRAPLEGYSNYVGIDNTTQVTSPAPEPQNELIIAQLREQCATLEVEKQHYRDQAISLAEQLAKMGQEKPDDIDKPNSITKGLEVE